MIELIRMKAIIIEKLRDKTLLSMERNLRDNKFYRIKMPLFKILKVSIYATD